MNWAKKIKAILGFFWVTVWKDSWLIDLIVDFFRYLLGLNLENRLQTILFQTQCKSLYTPQSKRYVKVLVDSSNTSGTIMISDMLLGSSQVGQATDKQSYKTLQEVDLPDYFQLSVSNDKIKLKAGEDFELFPDRGTIQFNKPLSDYGFDVSVEIVNGAPVSCYVLWAVYEEFLTVRDSFTGIMDIPQDWLWKYPGAVEAAWSIKQNGANQRDVKRLLGAIGGCPFSTVSGRIELEGNTVKIGDTQYKGTGTCLVTNGSLIQEDIKLFTGTDSSNSIEFPSVYTYKTGLPSQLDGIYVLTDAGVLYAPNSSQALSDGVLPLRQAPGQAISTAYKTLCQQRSSDSQILYAQLPNPVNPAEFIFQKVWGPSAVLIMTPPSNQADMQLAVKFIVQNTQLGSLVIAHSCSEGYPLLYPDKAVQQELMVYYNSSVNNGTSYKERYGDLVE